MLRLDYTFDASAKTITFDDSIIESNLEAIINSTDGIVIYNSFSPSTTGTLTGQVLTLIYDTSSMSDTDELQIFYGDTIRTVSGYTFEELISKVNVLVDDTNVATLLGGFINQGVSEIAGGMPSLLDGIADPLPNVLTPPLPELFTIGTVATSTSAAFVNMPDNFQRDLQLVVSSTGSEIDIADSFIDFVETYPLLNKSGRISEAIEHGKKLYYQGIPTSSELITLHYYRKPIAMVVDADTPDGISDHLQIPL